MATAESTITIELKEEDRELLKKIIELLENLNQHGFEKILDAMTPPGDDGNTIGNSIGPWS